MADGHGGDVALGFFEDLAGGLDVRAFEADDERDIEADALGRGDDGVGDCVALGDAAEDVDEDAFNLGAYVALAFVFFHLFVDKGLKMKLFLNGLLCMGNIMK